MGLLVGEAVHLVLDGRAVAGPSRLNCAVEHRGPVEVVEDDAVGVGVGVDDVARELGPPGGLVDRGVDGIALEDPALGLVAGVEAEVDRGRAARLDGRLAEVDAPGVDAGRRPGLETAEAQAPGDEAVGDAQRRGLAGAAGGLGGLPGDGLALKGRASGEDQRLGLVELPRDGGEAEDVVGPALRVRKRLLVQALHRRLLEREVWLTLEGLLHPEHVELLVGLGPRHLDGRALAGIEHPDLDEGAVDGAGHLAAEGIELADDVALGRAADRGVAGHQRDGVEVHRHHQRL